MRPSPDPTPSPRPTRSRRPSASILAVSTILIWVVQAGFGMGLMFFLASVTAMLVYVVDVRVRIDGVLGRSWFRKNA